MAGAVAEVTDVDFESEVLKSSQPVLVDFWAPWCGPCRQLAPLINQIAEENHGNLKVVKVNTDDSPNASMKYGITSIPTVVFFKGGEEVNRYVGIKPKSAYQAVIQDMQ